MRGRWREEETPNFWPAVADVFIGFLALFLTTGLVAYTSATQRGEEAPVAKEKFLEKFEAAFAEIPVDRRPVKEVGFSELLFRFPGDFLFEPCSTSPKATRALTTLKKLLIEDRDKIRRVEITGHTDNDRPGPRCFEKGIRTNWELSARRAITVLEMLAPEDGTGLDPEKIKMWAAGLGQYEPVPESADESENRRIEILVRFKERAGS